MRTTSSKPKITTSPWNLTPIKTWTNPWEASEVSSLDLQPSSKTYTDNILRILPERKVTSQKPKDRISFCDLKKIVTWSPSWKNKNSIDDNENSIEDLIPTYSTVEADENKPRGDFDTFSEIEIEEKNKIDVENVAGLKDDSDEEVDKVNDEIPFPTIMNNETKLLNWSDNQFDNSDDEINTYSIQTNKEDIYSPDEITANPQDNLITLQDDFDIIGKAVTFTDDDFNSEDPIPLDDVFPTSAYSSVNLITKNGIYPVEPITTTSLFRGRTSSTTIAPSSTKDYTVSDYGGSSEISSTSQATTIRDEPTNTTTEGSSDSASSVVIVLPISVSKENMILNDFVPVLEEAASMETSSDNSLGLLKNEALVHLDSVVNEIRTNGYET